MVPLVVDERRVEEVRGSLSSAVEDWVVLFEDQSFESVVYIFCPVQQVVLDVGAWFAMFVDYGMKNRDWEMYRYQSTNNGTERIRSIEGNI